MKNKFDIIVVGGGVSGVCAAVAAARTGMSVALIEASHSVGGIVTDGPLEALMTFHDEKEQVIKGIAEEIVFQLMVRDGSPGYIEDTVGYCKSLVPYDSEIMKIVLFELLDEAGCTIWLNSLVTKVFKSGNNITGVEVSGISSVDNFKCKAIIDTSGGANVAYLAEENVLFGRESDQKVQPMTTLCKVAGINEKLLKEYVEKNKQSFKLSSNANLNTRYLHLWGFGDVLHKGYESGKLSLKRGELQLMITPREGVAILNFSRISGDPRKLKEVSDAQVKTNYQVNELVEFFKINIPAFNSAYIVHTGRLGIRESGRVIGKYELQLNDILNKKNFSHPVARGAFPIDIHQPDGDSLTSKKITQSYSIPMESLDSMGVNNLFMAGRCISATHEALSSARISVTAMATGQAAGVMASYYVKTGKLSYKLIKNELLMQKALI